MRVPALALAARSPPPPPDDAPAPAPLDPATLASIRSAGMEEYAVLKRRIGANARRTGASLAGYLFLTVSPAAAAATLTGTAAGSLYLAWLARDVEAITPDTRVPVMAAQAVESPALRKAALLLASLATGLTPRLSIYVGLAAAWAAWNAAHPEAPLDLVIAGGAALGFGSYKGALIWELYECYRPRVDPDAGLRRERPVLDLPEVEAYMPGRDKEGKE